jgi:hypothetical protein
MTVYLAMVVFLASLILEQLIPLSNTGGYSTLNAPYPPPYKYRYSVDYVNITPQDVLNAGKSMRFSPASVNESPVILIPGDEEFENALTKVLSYCPKDITVEQFCNASDLVGFLDLPNGTLLGSANYSILSPYQGFKLNITLTDPPEYDLAYPPSADASMRTYFATPIPPGEELHVSGHYEPRIVRHEPGQNCDEWSCEEGMIVVVKKVFTVKFSNGLTLTDERGDVTFFFAHHDGCASQTNSHVRVIHCRDSDGSYYVRKVEMVFRNEDWESRWPPEYDIRGILKRGTITITGYHGNATKLLIDCPTYYACYPYMSDGENCYSFRGKGTVQLQKSNESVWSASFIFPLYYRGDAFVTASCSLYLTDSVNTSFFNITRTCPLGSFYYYYRPPYCEPDGSCIMEPAEYFTSSWIPAPDHAKKPYTCPKESRNAAEEFTLRALAEAVKNRTEDRIERVLENASKDSQWNDLFDNLNREDARKLLQYFYLVQIPLNIERNDSLNYTPLEAIIRQKASKNVIYALTPLFENTTRVNTTRTLCTLSQNWSRAVECTVSFIQLEAERFGKTLYNSSCGRYFAAELVEIRKPSIADAQKYIRMPEKMQFVKGYSPSPGIKYPQEEECEI